MDRPLLLSAFLFSLLATGTLSAQVSFGGRPYGPKATKLGLPDAPTTTMPEVDVEAFMAEDAASDAQNIPAPYRFGAPLPVNLSLTNSGVWHTLGNGDRVWRLEVACPGALNVTLIFSDYVIPDGGRVFVYNRVGEVAGGFTAQSNPGHTELGVFPMRGDRLIVEYVEPAAAAGQGSLRIGQVTHGYRDILGDATKGLNDSGPCNINVVCPEGDDWRDQIRSVAMIVVGGSGACTGQLLNNCSSDGTPYFLTANHCLGGSVASWSFRFNWDSPTCTTTTNGPTNQTVSGATLLASSAGSDVALLELSSAPPSSYNVYYSGWDRSGDQPTAQTSIHHPSGDIKKISHEEDDADQQTWGGPPAQCWHIPSWDSGTTEPGSSGSGLWDQNGRLIGQLYGGSASCGFNFDDYYGRFNVSWPTLEQYLGVSCGTTLDGYDPNGTAQQAYDAGVTSISAIPSNVCNSSEIVPQITIKNYGTNAFSTVTVNYELNGGAPVSVPFNALVASGQTANFTLPTINVANGVNTLLVYTTDPDGQADGNTANDDRQKSFNVSNPGEVVTIQIKLDDYGSETTWELTPQGGGTVIAQGGPYSDNQDGVVISSEVCLSNGCYVVTLDDAYGDGICCGTYGNGDFWVLNSLGDTLVNGNGDFNTTTSVTFCLENVGVDDVDPTEGLSIWPNPGTGLFEVQFLRPSSGSVRLDVHDALGRLVARRSVNGSTVRTTLDLGTLAEGSYTLEAISGNDRSVRRLVISR
jgi:lysyl endopeptidase